MRVLLTLAALLCVSAPARAQSRPLTTDDWREDLRALARELPRRHANAFHSITREEFERRVAALDARLPSLDADAAIVGLASIAASIGDGHTAVHLPQSWPRLTIIPAWFGCFP